MPGISRYSAPGYSPLSFAFPTIFDLSRRCLGPVSSSSKLAAAAALIMPPAPISISIFICDLEFGLGAPAHLHFIGELQLVDTETLILLPESGPTQLAQLKKKKQPNRLGQLSVCQSNTSPNWSYSVSGSGLGLPFQKAFPG